MVVLTNVGLEVSVVRNCVSCKHPRWRSEYRAYMSDKQCDGCRSKREAVRCKHCGGPAGLTARMKPRKFCTSPECVEARQLYAGRRANANRSARIRAHRTKRCGACHVVKPKTSEHFCAVVRDKQTGEVLRYHSYCRPCFNAERADRLRHDPVYRDREYGRLRKLHERRKNLLSQDPEAYAAFRAHERDRQRAWRLRKQAETDDIAQQAHERPQGYSGTGPNMPVKPLWLAVVRFMEDRSLTQGATAAMFGMSERSLYRWEHEAEYVRLEQADAALVAMDMLWFEVWDEATYPEVARIWEGE